MYEEPGPDGRRAYTVAEIAAEFEVSRPTIYRHQPKAG
jgi:AcrR family transcriptional regulator